MHRLLAVSAAAVACLFTICAAAAAQSGAPETTIVSGPTVSSSPTVTFVFRSATAGATFECALDSSVFFPCASPLTLRNQRPGSHGFAVRAVAGGVRDATPAVTQFLVVPDCRGFAPTRVVSGNAPARGTNGNDVIVVFAGTAVVDARGGNDVICVLEGHHQVLGGAGDDFVSGGPAGGAIDGGTGGDSLKGGAGPDRLVGGDGRDFLVGGRSNDRLSGGADRDVLRGGDGRDSCSGGTDIDRASSCESAAQIP